MRTASQDFSPKISRTGHGHVHVRNRSSGIRPICFNRPGSVFNLGWHPVSSAMRIILPKCRKGAHSAERNSIPAVLIEMNRSGKVWDKSNGSELR